MIQLDIVTPTRKLVSTVCDAITIPGYKGELGILPEHTNLVSALDTGVVKYVKDNKKNSVAVRGGFAQISKDKIMLLVDAGIREQDIDAVDVQKQSTQLDQKLVAAEVGVEEREKLFVDRIWLNSLQEMKK